MLAPLRLDHEAVAQEPITLLAREANRLHDEFQVHFAGQVRLTRDLAALDELLAAVAELQLRADAATGHSEGRWEALRAILTRRAEDYHAERGAVAQIQAAASRSDRMASALTSRARLVLHRYVRHFAGQSRRGRDRQRLVEMLADLHQLAAALHPMLSVIHLRSVAEEIEGVLGFVGFFADELEQISTAEHSGGVAAQAQLGQQLCAALCAGWQTEVVGQPEQTRRPALLRRYAVGLDAVIAAMLAVDHANLPDAHRAAIDEATVILGHWQAEAAQADALRAALSPEQVVGALWNRADALWQLFRGRWGGALQHQSELQWLTEMADAMEEVERQLTACSLTGADVAAARLTNLRDNLVYIERCFDTATAAQVPG